MISGYNTRVEKMKGISRIDSRSTHGWFVRAYKNGITFSRLFSDRRYGGMDSALEAASEYRDSLHEQIQRMPSEPRKRRLVMRDSRNKTGVIGVTRTARHLPNGTLSECYSVSWRPAPGVQKCTSFSIRKYGEQEAFRLAVKHRHKMIAQAYGPKEARRWADEVGLERILSGAMQPNSRQ